MSPDSAVLRNRVGALSVDALRDAENDLVEYRVVELRERPGLITRSYDLPHLRGLHRHLFQDVYEWAGELRTVGLARDGGDSFMPPGEIERPVAHAASRIAETDRLRSIPADGLPGEVAYLYDYLNFAHPFREGNGRTQREFFAQLLEESGREIDWSAITSVELHSACHVARNSGVLAPLVSIFTTILR